MDLHFLIKTAYAATEAAAEAKDASVLALFGLNVKLFIAQLVNFGIVLFVLWKWVFRPVAKGLSERTAKIEKSLQDAKQVQEDKINFEGWKSEEIAKVRTEASEIINKAKDEANLVKNDITEKAKQEKEKILAQAKSQLTTEKERAIAEIKQEVATLVVAASEKILKAKLDSPKDKELIKESLKQIAK